MSRWWKFAAFVSAAVGLAVLAVVLIYGPPRPRQVVFVTGAVLRDDSDLHKRRPIENATVTADSGLASGQATSDAAGLFRLSLRPAVPLGQPLRLAFRHPDYLPLEITKPADDRIHVVRLAPKSPESSQAGPPAVAIGNVRVRYAVRTASAIEVGSAVRTFEVLNTGNVPCDGRSGCSPDGKWRAAIGSVSLEAGGGRQFRNVRVSCIAGPCAFSRIESDEFSRGGRMIRVSVRNWSDPVTYLVEAEVVHTTASDVVRRSYPAIFGRSLNFTLPAAARGPSLEAEVDGAEIIFPLGPSLTLSWANCRLEIAPDRTKLYRCELKPGYRFK